MKKEEKAFHHRATLKQKNKSFKSKHATKTELRNKSKGKTVRVSIRGKVTKEQRKVDRKNAARIEQRKKQEEVVKIKRKYTGRHGIPKIVTILSLCEDVTTKSIAERLFESVGAKEQYNPDKKVNELQVDTFKQRFIVVELEKSGTMSTNGSAASNYDEILDTSLVSDYLILGLSAQVEVDEAGKNILEGIQSLGTSTVMAVGQHLNENLTGKPQQQHNKVTMIKASLLSFVQYYFPKVSQVYSCDNEREASVIVRSIANTVPDTLGWRDSKPYLVAEEPVKFVAHGEGQATNNEQEQIGDLEITGYLRGATDKLTANRLVYIPEMGEYQIKVIYEALPPPSQSQVDSANQSMQVDNDDLKVISIADPERQDSLVSINEVAEMETDQIGPDESEMDEWRAKMAEYEREEQEYLLKANAQADSNGTKVRTKRVPKGTSLYQAAWILDEDNQSENESESGSDDEEDSDMQSDDQQDQDSDEQIEEEEEEEEEEEFEEINVDEFGNPIDPEDKTNTNDGDELPNEQDTELELLEYLREREKQRKEDVMFPDEVNTPLDIPARQRFAKYRGMQSFRTSAWDPYENLPADYSRIFQLENPKAILKNPAYGSESADGSSTSGVGSSVNTRVKLVVANVAYKDFSNKLQANPKLFVCFGLLQHENKYSVIHLLVKKRIFNTDGTDGENPANPESNPIIKSKDMLNLRFGFRKLSNVRPIFSQHTSKTSPNNVYKFCRFLSDSDLTVATVYAPITFGFHSTPAIFYLPQKSSATVTPINSLGTPAGSNSSVAPIAIGSLYSIDPTKVIVKRVVLTGVPYKINKKTATIRFMFYNPIDINYFKPIQLTTKYGRFGHIKESLGTHGYMKCVFNAPLSAVDTVCLYLYKRVFPKWELST